MMRKHVLTAAGALALAGVAAAAVVQAQTPSKASFFLTSVGTGKGADLGGLQGADAHCAALAKSAGLVRQNWRAYLSTLPSKDKDGKDVPGVNARDRIGKGPWTNTKGVVIARNVADLHSDRNRLTQDTALTEKGERVSGRPESQAKTGPNQHDILTGSDPQGLYIVAGDTTCGNWTKSSGEAPAHSAIVGHHDRVGLNDFRHMKSWNSAHGSRGCSQDNLRSSGGAGLFYCFSEK
jgi:hypothetical protein